MAVFEVQSGLPPETNKENGYNLTAEEEIILIEDILKCEGNLFGKMKGLKGGRYCQTKRVNLEGYHSNLKSNVRNLKPCKIARNYPCGF